MADETFFGSMRTLIPTDNAQRRLDSSGKSAESELTLQYNEISESK